MPRRDRSKIIPISFSGPAKANKVERAAGSPVDGTNCCRERSRSAVNMVHVVLDIRAACSACRSAPRTANRAVECKMRVIRDRGKAGRTSEGGSAIRVRTLPHVDIRTIVDRAADREGMWSGSHRSHHDPRACQCRDISCRCPECLPGRSRSSRTGGGTSHSLPAPYHFVSKR